MIVRTSFYDILLAKTQSRRETGHSRLVPVCMPDQARPGQARQPARKPESESGPPHWLEWSVQCEDQ